MVRIGLTGGIAAGKSTVAAHLASRGAVLIDYDLLARQVVAAGSAGLARIVEEFGPRALKADGELDRAWMAGHVFASDSDPGARQRLDAIEHPLIYDRAAGLERDARAGGGTAPLVVHDVPLLAEVIDTIPFAFDHIVTVEAPDGVRIKRMMETRGMTRRQAEDRIAHQSSSAERRALADVVIDSTQPIEQMFEHLDMLIAQWR